MEETGRSDAELMQLQRTVVEQRHVLQDGQVAVASQAWLKPQLDSPEGTKQVFSLMERMVATPSFLYKLTTARSKRENAGKANAEEPPEEVQPDVTKAEFWEDGSLEANLEEDSHGFEKVSKEERQVSAEPLDSYVVVEKEDVLDAIGTFVAAYLAELPEAQNLKPAELQRAIQHAFKELQQSRMRRLWGWGRCIYRCVAFSYGAFSVYENPWLVRACLAALWTASKFMFGLLI